MKPGQALFDGGVYVEVPVPKPLTDPLGFKDQKKYPDRLREARRKTGEEEAMLVAEGEMHGFFQMPNILAGYETAVARVADHITRILKENPRG